MSLSSLPTASLENNASMWTMPTCDQVFHSCSPESGAENVLWLKSLGVVVPGSAHLPLHCIILEHMGS